MNAEEEALISGCHGYNKGIDHTTCSLRRFWVIGKANPADIESQMYTQPKEC